jgi:hypothetical protein
MRTAERHERICDRRLEDACTDRSLWAPELEACAEACVGLAVRMSRENRRTIPASLVTLCNFLTNESSEYPGPYVPDSSFKSISPRNRLQYEIKYETFWKLD